MLKLPILPEIRGIFKLIKPFSGTMISIGSSRLWRINDVAKSAYEKNTIDLARVDFSVSPQGDWMENPNWICRADALSSAASSL